MDEVEVQVVQLEVLKGGLAGRKDVLLCVVGVPVCVCVCVCVRMASPLHKSLGTCMIQPINTVCWLPVVSGGRREATN